MQDGLHEDEEVVCEGGVQGGGRVSGVPPSWLLPARHAQVAHIRICTFLF